MKRTKPELLPPFTPAPVATAVVPPAIPPVPKPHRIAVWLGQWTRQLCPVRQRCDRTGCWLQPVCACTRTELADQRRQEGRFLIALAICGLVLIVLAVLLW